MNDVIRVDGVHKYFGATRAVDGMSLTVPHGQVLGLLGLNGAGKTTLMRLLTGLLRAERGSIAVLGQNPWTMAPETRRRIGYLSEKDFPFPDLNLEQATRFTSRLYPSWDSDYLGKLVEMLQVPGQTAYAALSRGQQRKFHLVLTLAPRPELLLLDDPALGLDVTVRREFVQSIIPLLQQGQSTVIFSSHIMSDVERVADSVAIVHAGRLLFQDSLDHLKESARQIVARGPLPAASGVVRVQQSEGEVRTTVLDPDPAMIETLRRQGSLYDVRTLGLEDLFIDIVEGEMARRFGAGRDERA